MRQIQQLNAIESQLRERRCSPVLRAVIRAQQSQLVVQRMRRALVALKSGGRHLPQSLIGQAIDYAWGQWSTLDGRVEMDNNLVENAIRSLLAMPMPVTVGRSFTH